MVITTISTIGLNPNYTLGFKRARQANPKPTDRQEDIIRENLPKYWPGMLLWDLQNWNVFHSVAYKNIQ